MRDDSAEILFQSFLLEALARSPHFDVLISGQIKGEEPLTAMGSQLRGDLSFLRPWYPTLGDGKVITLVFATV